MTNRARRSRRVAAIAGTSGAAAMAAVLGLGTPALAQDGDQPPGYVEPEPPDIDPNASGLMLSEGATLAEPRVVDITSVVEQLGGAGGAGGGGTGGSGDTGDPDDGQTPDGEADTGGGQREEISPSQHKFTLQTDVLFAEGSGEISEESQGALADVAAAIDEYHPTEVNVFGFTDDQGSYESGEVLSEERAQNTYRVLLDLIQNPEGIVFNVRGYSEDFPLYDNDTEEGRQKNRRVEISWPTTE
ncbi:OmpA family protein [Streptomyces sp. 4N509B]|uniref:OmpA family protein n=1 Tax=Streptomyces sp. 4N509B TaxID=3457413 RepID=UPI003FD33BCD